ncbi:MAG: trypsin-like peptidase domain-containing protein [Acidobacteria bacterium]|nr:trypsin-like peptidase domain-containing protein [Acidobacteriota bacterium]
MPLNTHSDRIEQLRHCTVRILFAPAVNARGGSGSGVITESTGWIVTNAHVIQNNQPMVELHDGRRFPARVVAFARRHDLALLKIDTLGLPAAELGDSSRLRPGEMVIAAGNPLGFTGAVSTGVVHTVGPLRGAGPNNWVQADVRLAPGNSGGPLADALGRVIGINTMVARGLALAIPSNVVRDFLRAGVRKAA